MVASALRDEICRWLRFGLTPRDAAKLTGASPAYIYRVRREEGIGIPLRHRDQTTLVVAADDSWSPRAPGLETTISG